MVRHPDRMVHKDHVRAVVNDPEVLYTFIVEALRHEPLRSHGDVLLPKDLHGLRPCHPDSSASLYLVFVVLLEERLMALHRAIVVGGGASQISF